MGTEAAGDILIDGKASLWSFVYLFFTTFTYVIALCQRDDSTLLRHELACKLHRKSNDDMQLLWM